MTTATTETGSPPDPEPGKASPKKAEVLVPNSTTNSEGFAVGVPAEHQRASTPAVTTARKTRAGSNKKVTSAGQPKIRKGKRVYIKRSALIYLIPIDSPAYDIFKVHTSREHRFYGTCGNGTGVKGEYNICFESLPENH